MTSRVRGLALNALLSIFALSLFFGGIEVLLGLFGVRPVLADRDPYVGFQSAVRLFEVSENRREISTASNKLEFFNHQEFSNRKSAGTSRVFTVGGSTTYGRPYDDRTSFSAWLRGYLGVVDPTRRWEVINAGGISYASYRIALLMEELAEYEPDLFIVYSGNNEFLERRTYPDLMTEPLALTKTRLLLQRSRLWALGRAITGRATRLARERYELKGEVSELLNHSAGLDYYQRDQGFKAQVLNHYRFNLQRMVDIARASGARVILVTVPVNERDFSPFKSQHAEKLSLDQRVVVEDLLEEAGQALEAEDWAEALRLADLALEIDSLYAESHFMRGRALMGLAAPSEAQHAFARAIAEDVCPLRALEEINEIVLESAERNKTGLVDFRMLLKRKLEEKSGHRNLGDEFFLDHVHLSVEAHGELAAALVDELGSMGLLELTANWRDASHTRIAEEILSRVDSQMTATAHKNLAKVLIWAGKTRDAEKYIRLAERTLKDDWEVHFNAATVAMRERGDYRTARERVKTALELKPDSARAWDLLAVTYQAEGQLDKAVEAALRAVRFDPEMVMAWSNLSIFYRQQGNLDSASQALRQALRIDPNFAEGLNNLGNIHFAMGRFQDALKSYQGALALRGDFPEAKTNAGLVLGALERYEEAKVYFRDVISADPNVLVAQLGLAQTLIITGEPAAALEHLDKVLELEPRSAKARELRSIATQAITRGGGGS